MKPQDPDERQAPESQDEVDVSEAPEDDSLRDLLKGALSERDEGPRPDVLGGVQRKIRARSQGKFYSDRWSTSRHPPIAVYLVTSAVMLAIVLAVYAAMAPLSGEPVPVKNEPAPVRVIPPER